MTDKKKKRYLEVLEEIKKERNLNVEEEMKKVDNYWKQYEASVQDSTLSRQSKLTGNKNDDFKETARAIIKNSLTSGPSSPRYSQSYISGNSSEDFEEAADKIRKDISMEANYRQRARLTASEMKKSQKKQKELEQERSNYIINYDATIQAEGEEILSKLNEEEMKSLDLYVKAEGAPLLKDDYIKGLREKGYTEKEIEKAADVRKRQLDAIKTAEEMEKSAKFAEEHEVLASILSVPQKFIGGIASAGSSIMQYFDDPYRSINTNTGAFLLTNKANAARQEVASDMGSVGAFLYNTGMSIGDMSLSMLAGNKAAALSGAAKVGSATTLGSMGVQAFSDTVIDLTARGANAEQAMQGGLAAGTFEILFEKVSLGNFNKLKQVPATELKGFVKNVAKSIGVNASEEVFTEAANIIYDTLANGDISNLELQVKALMEEGYSESEARSKVWGKFGLQVLEAGLAGGLTGGTLGVAGQAKGTYRASQNSRAIIESEVEKRAGEERKKTAIDNEVEKIIAERSETFGELSEKEKNAIREDVINKVENGEIDYSETEIKDDIIKGIQKQVNEELDRGELSIDAVETALAKEEKETINRLSEELENAKTDEERSIIEAEINKTRLSLAEKMQKSLRSDIRLQEIYKQEMLKSEDIDVVEQKTDSDITKELIKSAKAVNMNNTRKSHELFDFVNKVANDIKTNYRFVNDAQLRQLGYEVDGQAVNGLVRKNSDGTYNVLLNVEAGKESQALAVIIGHETTHLLETTEEYSRLKTLLKEYAKSKGEYDSKLESIKKLYKDVDADIEGEVTADLIGRYLLTDEKFVKELSVKEPNIFQKLYNHIKRIVKMATAGSEQQKQLLKLQESFKKAYKELGSTQKTSEAKSIDGEISTELERTISEEVKYSLKQFEDGRRFVEVDLEQNQFDGLSDREKGKLATKIIKQKFMGKVIGSENKAYVNSKGAEEYGFPLVKLTPEKHDAKMRASTELDNLLDAGFNFRSEADGKDGHIHGKAVKGFNYFDVIFKVGDNYYSGVINIADTQRGLLFKDVTKIKDVTKDTLDSYGEKPQTQFLRTSSTNSISNTEQKSNIKYSIAGEKALNKNNEYLKQAKVMELAGKTSEEIRKDTGWFRGLDNKWRFEIDSSEMKVDTKGKFHRNPDISRYQTLLEKAYFTGTATEAEIKELQQLDKTLKGALTEPKKLGDLIDYPQLLEAYPDLADVNIVFSEDLGEIKGTYSSKRNEIVINKSLKSNMKELKQTLLHEMQHAIQDIEGFAKGSNTIGLDYWNSAGEIEARDVANRLSLNEQQRKDVRPDIDNDSAIVKFSLRNKNITEDTEIPYVVNDSYITVQKNNKIALAELQDRVKNLPRGTYENKATGYKADINRTTIGKILNPTNNNGHVKWSKKYINNLNAATQLPELFKNAVYVDTKENQKSKNTGKEILGYHHFIAPIYMNGEEYRVRIVAREKEKSDTLYIVETEILPLKDGVRMAAGQMPPTLGATPSTITIPDLIKDVKIYNYDTQENQEYTPEDIRYHLSKRGENITPVKGWGFYGEEIFVKNRKTGDDIAPVRGDILPEAGSKTENAATVMEDIAPVRKDIKPKTTEMSGDIAPVKATEKITEYVNTQPRGEEKQRPLLRSAIGSTSREIKRLYGSKYDPTKDIARLYKGIHEGKYNEEEIARISTDIGQRIVENIKSKKVRTDEANEVLGLLRQTKVKLDSEQKTEVEAKYGSYNEYRKNMMGKIILSKDGTSLEAVWEDWSELYPDIFDIDMDPKAMPEELENIMSSLQRSYQIEDTPDAEEVGAEIYDRFFSIPQRKKTRAEVQDELFEGIRKEFENNGYDIDEVFSNAKSKTTFSSVDNTPQRFIEKTFGYKAGQIINDLTINKEAENESKCVRWLNTITGKKTGLLPRLSEKYNIKPGSKEDAAVQMYAEGFYVNKKQEYVRYGDEELAKDFPDEQTQENIKKLARDPEVRAFYDNTLRMINETRKRNAYPEIPKRENYFLHFHAMEDTFSKIGIPFNINDIKLKDLPSDLNGITAGLRPGQPYFASANRRTGIRTTYGALRGMERYAFAAGRQIYHIDDIQTLRAIWKHIADTYGQAKGLENLDELDRKQQEEQIKRVYDGHLSTFARFINEQANILAGKTAALDRGFESIFGRKGLAVLNFFDKQAGRNAVGYNISSALTNLVAGVQGISKMPKADAIKAFAQTASNKLNNLRGEDDGFAEQNDFIVRRKGSSSFYRTPWQKATDRGYVMMQAVDDITTEFVVRGKYNEYIRRGMSEADAHEQAGKWAAKLLGDRSLGQMPQLYNSKVMNIFAKFQLEVRNQLDSMLYDTVKEAEIDTESISSAKKRNSIKAAKITSTLAQLAVFQHLFGKAFEAVTGYNPAFDIISVLMTMLGIGDDEDSEDTFKDNLEQAFFELLEDLPYTSTLTGGRIPISSMLPVEELVTGKDSYGNEKSRLKTLLEASPYLLPAGYGQVKKTYQGLKMFDEDLPVKGSYTNSGNLRYPVEDTVMNRIQAGLFGQYANKNAREYFDEERIPLKTKDIEEYKELNIPIGDYWKYKDEIKKRDTKPEKVDYISSLDLPVSKKNLLANNVLDRKEKVDLDGYEDYGSFEEFDFATKNPGEYSISKTVGGYSSYKKYREEISSFKADRDSNGKSISGTKKAKIVNYINSLNTSYGSKLILYKMQYPSDDTYNYEIVEYLNSQQYLSYNDIKEALEAMEFTVDSEGNVRW